MRPEIGILQRAVFNTGSRRVATKLYGYGLDPFLVTFLCQPPNVDRLFRNTDQPTTALRKFQQFSGALVRGGTKLPEEFPRFPPPYMYVRITGTAAA